MEITFESVSKQYKSKYALVGGNVFQRTHIEQKIPDGKVPIEDRILGHIADLGQERFAQRPHILTVHPDRTAVPPQNAHKGVDECGFPGPVYRSD